MLYGANGYTGRLIAAEAVQRGMRPILAGRSSNRIGPLAAALGCPSRVFSLQNPEQIAANLSGIRAVLNCAGPFSATAQPMMDACLKSRVHYLDITGEIDVIEAAAARHQFALEAGITLIPAVGFDVVPSDCLAAMLAPRISGASRLELAVKGLRAVSPGTAKTILEALPYGGRVRIDGHLVTVPTAWKTAEIPFPEGPRPAMTAPWGDVASAWYSTGIPNIEVYLAFPAAGIWWLRRVRGYLSVLRVGWVRRAALGPVRWLLAGPTTWAKQHQRGSLWARVSDDTGNQVQGTLQTASPYQLTVWTALGALENVLAGSIASGFLTPSKAFGPDFILTIPGTEFRAQ